MIVALALPKSLDDLHIGLLAICVLYIDNYALTTLSSKGLSLKDAADMVVYGIIRMGSVAEITLPFSASLVPPSW